MQETRHPAQKANAERLVKAQFRSLRCHLLCGGDTSQLRFEERFGGIAGNKKLKAEHSGGRQGRNHQERRKPAQQRQCDLSKPDADRRSV